MENILSWIRPLNFLKKNLSILIHFLKWICPFHLYCQIHRYKIAHGILLYFNVCDLLLRSPILFVTSIISFYFSWIILLGLIILIFTKINFENFWFCFSFVHFSILLISIFYYFLFLQSLSIILILFYIVSQNGNVFHWFHFFFLLHYKHLKW
jgi:hypothetical protein